MAMKPRVMAELLAQYTDRIIAGRDDTSAYLSLFRSHSRELAPLFAIVRLLKSVLVRTEPAPGFIESLGLGLRVAAEEAILQQLHEERQSAWPPDRKVVIGAAIGSLASVAAIIVLTRSRASAKNAA